MPEQTEIGIDRESVIEAYKQGIDITLIAGLTVEHSQYRNAVASGQP